MAGAVLTRYDGWFLAASLGIVMACILTKWWRHTNDQLRRRRMTKSFAEFLLLNALVPAFWLIYNYNLSGRALDFANGPYSAKAIALRTTAACPPYPGQHNVLTAALYFLKAAQLNVGSQLWSQLLFALALAGARSLQSGNGDAMEHSCCSGFPCRFMFSRSPMEVCRSSCQSGIHSRTQRAVRSGIASGHGRLPTSSGLFHCGANEEQKLADRSVGCVDRYCRCKLLLRLWRRPDNAA